MVSLADAEGISLYEGPSVERILGFKPEELIGKNVLSLLHPDEVEKVQELFGYCATNPGSIVTARVRYLHKNGSWRILEAVASNLLHKPGVEAIVINSRDITDRIELEDQIQQVKSLASIGRVATAVAHEVNNLLMSIQPAIDILKNKYPEDARIARLTSLLTQAVVRGSGISRDLVGFAGDGDAQLTPLPVRETLEAFVAEARPLTGDGITLTLDAADDLHFLVEPRRMHQALLNLVINARDAMRCNGRIELVARRVSPGSRYYEALEHAEAGFVQVTVKDDGPGVSPEVRDRIFEPFFTTKRSGGGLGLWIVQQIMRHQGGAIFLDRAETGSAFVLLFRAPAGHVP
jgi:PAS domain S-box-containing protein